MSVWKWEGCIGEEFVEFSNKWSLRRFHGVQWLVGMCLFSSPIRIRVTYFDKGKIKISALRRSLLDSIVVNLQDLPNVKSGQSDNLHEQRASQSVAEAE